MKGLDLLIGAAIAMVAAAILPLASAADAAAIVCGGGLFLAVLAWQVRERIEEGDREEAAAE